MPSSDQAEFESDQRTTNELIAAIPNKRTRRTAQKAAYLLGMSSEMQELSPAEQGQIRMAQILNNAS